MGRSMRNYWSKAELLRDYVYWRRWRNYTPGARENMRQSWEFFLRRIGCPNQDVDAFAMRQMEGW